MPVRADRGHRQHAEPGLLAQIRPRLFLRGEAEPALRCVSSARPEFWVSPLGPPRCSLPPGLKDALGAGPPQIRAVILTTPPRQA